MDMEYLIEMEGSTTREGLHWYITDHHRYAQYPREQVPAWYRSSHDSQAAEDCAWRLNSLVRFRFPVEVCLDHLTWHYRISGSDSLSGHDATSPLWWFFIAPGENSHWFRAYRSPVEAYDSETNRGQPVQGLKAECHLGLCKTKYTTDTEIHELETQIPGPGTSTDAIKTAKDRAEHAVILVLVNSPHISTEGTLLTIPE